jgi:mRNA deadenylase 3'-5' endonuclease subunit Ccr4
MSAVIISVPLTPVPEPCSSPTNIKVKRRTKGLSGLSLSSEALTESRDREPPATDIPSVAKRPTVIVNSTLAASATPSTTLGVMSYNVLADRYITTEKYFHCPQWALGKDYRARGIAHEISYYTPDIVCMQELTREMKECYLDPLLSAEGYQSSPLVQILSRTLRRSNNGEGMMRNSMTDQSVEGIALYYNAHRFTFVEHVEIPLDDIPMSLEGGDQKYTPSSHNVALCVVLRSNLHPTSVLVVATVHLFYGWERPDIQIGQLMRINIALAEKRDAYVKAGYSVGCVFTGDLNSEMGGRTIQYVKRGMLNGTLRSAYESYAESNSTHVTAISQSFRGTIDYVWYEDASLGVAEVVETRCGMQKVKEFTDDTGRLLLPTPEYPSDHLPVVCKLVTKGMRL